MTHTEKEQVQYLLTEYLERDLPGEEKRLLFKLLDKEQDNKEWEEIVEELIASEQEQQNYESGKWETVIETILNNNSEERDAFKKTSLFKGKIIADAKVKRLPGRKRWLWGASVAALLIMIVTIWFIMTGDGKSVIATAYAQQKKIILRDETEIVLNSNSHITYLKRWKNGQPREVWLQGEALFKVKHINTNTDSISAEERFIVHTDLANIEVLGTVFNIRERRGKTEIVLERGKIKVSFLKSGERDIIMQPGQMVTVTVENKKVVTNTIKPEEYTAWTQQKLILTDASFKQIVEYMEDNFGKQIILTDPQLANRKVEGTFKMDNMDDALLVLSKALDVEIVKKNDTLIFAPK